ncbi:hypothetical protein C4577_03050 [Candidatus Parcubacteria bacterium]|nr:MAG: hypothetical protein C4577_03050 [Candidatus Parcubacteria bacterium]
MFAIKGTKVLNNDLWFSTPFKVESWWTGSNFGAGHFKKKFPAKDQVERELDHCLSWMHPPMNNPYSCNWDDSDDPFSGQPRDIYKLEVIEIGENDAVD